MSLDHDFLLVDRDADGDGDLSRFINDPRSLHLHDDIVRYMYDTLLWIPCYNPSRRESCMGFNMWGETILEQPGALIAHHIFLSWANLFAMGPAEIELQGNFDLDLERHQRFTLHRDECNATLRELAEYALKIHHAQGKLFLYHFGV